MIEIPVLCLYMFSGDEFSELMFRSFSTMLRNQINTISHNNSLIGLSLQSSDELSLALKYLN